jgi:hypothetical protein
MVGIRLGYSIQRVSFSHDRQDSFVIFEVENHLVTQKQREGRHCSNNPSRKVEFQGVK